MLPCSLLLILSSIVLVAVAQQVQDGEVQEAPRPASRIDLVKSFDLPRSAPTARIIRLSQFLNRKSTRGRNQGDLFADKAGSFDDFSRFKFKDEANEREDESSSRSEESGSSEDTKKVDAQDNDTERKEISRDRVDAQARDMKSSTRAEKRHRDKDDDDSIIGDFFKEEGRQ